jgi:N-acylglucosamine-6-phosphate 2-epimerase
MRSLRAPYLNSRLGSSLERLFVMTVCKLPEKGLIVSVQADSSEPLGNLACLLAMSESVLLGGAQGLRLANLDLIRAIKQRHPNLPVIGLHKPDPLPTYPLDSVYITATLEAAMALAEAGADVIATDATQRPRPEGLSLATWASELKRQFPEVALMADCSTLEDGLKAADLGFEVIGTTLSGYTLETQEKQALGPDFEMLEALHQQLPASIYRVMEGRLETPDQVAQALELGASGAVVGSAITRPHWITKRFSTRQGHALSK